MDLLSTSKSGIILGNIKEHKVFDYSGIREENQQVEFGYRHFNGLNCKIMVARYVQGGKVIMEDIKQELLKKQRRGNEEDCGD